MPSDPQFGTRITLAIGNNSRGRPVRSMLRHTQAKARRHGICEMTCDETDLQQGDDMDVLVVSDEALEEAACGGLMRGSPTLAYGSYCFACRPHFVSS